MRKITDWIYLGQTIEADEKSVGTGRYSVEGDIDRDLLEELFGVPTIGQTDKVSYMYVFENAEGQIATIYDMNGEDGHIGAKSKKAGADFVEWFNKMYLIDQE